MVLKRGERGIKLLKAITIKYGAIHTALQSIKITSCLLCVPHYIMTKS